MQEINSPPPPKVVIKTLPKQSPPETFQSITNDLLFGLSKTQTKLDKSSLLNISKQLNNHILKVEKIFKKENKALMDEVSSQWSLIIKSFIYQYSNIPPIRLDVPSKEIYKALSKACDKWRQSKE